MKTMRLFLGALALTLFAGAAQAADRRGDFEIKPADRTMGNRNAKVVLIEYGSFTCSHCADFAALVMPSVKKAYVDTGKVLFVFRHFPRSLADAQAEKMARCAPVARYFPIADRLFQTQARWALNSATSRAELVKIGQEMGLQPAAINKCMDATTDDARMNASAEEAMNRYVLAGTPHLVINGKPQSAVGFPELAKILDRAATGK
jgi:protein-disulfide isomerase